MTETRGEIIARGAGAKALIENPVLTAAFDQMFKNLFKGFLDGQKTTEQVLELHRQAISIKAARGLLKGYIEDAQLEEINKKLDEKS